MSCERASRSGIDLLTQDVSDINLSSGEEGSWETVAKQNENTARSNAARVDAVWKLGFEGVSLPHALVASQDKSTPLQLPIQDGSNVADKAAKDDGKQKDSIPEVSSDVEDGPDSGTLSSDEDDSFLSDGFDSDEDQLGHEARKNHKMLKVFFETLDKLTLDEVNSPARQWHCPACQGGPCAIFWYRGLFSFGRHVRTKGSIRPKLHQGFAELLEEELRRKGTSMLPAGQSLAHQESLKREGKDHDIVWPPMVVILNTRLDKGDDDKWRGMSNQELLGYFSSYAAMKARHSYDSEGHRGISLLIFESSAVGYLEALKLHAHFLEQGTGREAWKQGPKLFGTGERRQLYGCLATEDDVELFNQYCQGKQRVKYEMRSYFEMVVSSTKQMSEDNQQLPWFKQKVAEEQRHSKALEESLRSLSAKLRQTSNENRIIKLRLEIHHKQNQEELDFQDRFFREQTRQFQESVNAKEDMFEKDHPDGGKKVEELSSHDSSLEALSRRMEDLECLFKSHDQEVLQLVLERDELAEVPEEKKDECKKKCLEKLAGLQNGSVASLALLMEKYAPTSSGSIF